MNIGAFLFIGLGVIFIFALISGSIRIIKKEKKQKEEYLPKLEPLKGRIRNYDSLVNSLKNLKFLVLKNNVDTILRKYELIDSILPYKKEISNYDEIVGQLENIKTSDIDIIEANVNKIIKQMKLSEKYGEDIAEKLINHEYFLGMTVEQLIDCKGKPTKIENEVLKTKTKEIYIYGNKNSGDVFTFVNGELERFKDR